MFLNSFLNGFFIEFADVISLNGDKDGPNILDGRNRSPPNCTILENRVFWNLF